MRLRAGRLPASIRSAEPPVGSHESSTSWGPCRPACADSESCSRDAARQVAALRPLGKGHTKFTLAGSLDAPICVVEPLLGFGWPAVIPRESLMRLGVT